MDSTIVATTSHAAWELLADLARFASNTALVCDGKTLAQSLASALQKHLPCSWGLVVLRHFDDTLSRVSWGLDAEREHALAKRNGALDAETMLILPLSLDSHDAGVVVLPRTQAEAVLPAGVQEALRQQITMLLVLHQREAVRHYQREAIDSDAQVNFELLGNLDVQQLLDALVKRLLHLSCAHDVVIYTVGDDGKLDVAAHHNLPEPFLHTRIAIGEGVVGRAALQRATEVVADYPSYPHHLAEEPAHWQCGIAVPMLSQDDLLGVVLLMCIDSKHFSKVEIQQVEDFVRPATLMLRNAQLFAQQQHRARELFVLYENSQVIGTTLNLEPMLTRVAENIALAMGSDYCAIHLLDQASATTLYETAAYHVDGNGGSSLRYSLRSYQLIAHLLHSGEQLVLDNNHRSGANQELLTFLGYQSGLLLPLRLRDHAIGLLAIGYTEQPHTFTNTEINLGQTLANQIATAILNARLFESEQQRTHELETLQRISQRLGSELSLDETVDTILDSMQSLVPFAGAQLSLYNEETQHLQSVRLVGMQGYSDGQPYSSEEGLTGYVARYHKTVRLQEFNRPPARANVTMFDDGAPVRSYLGIPLVYGNQLYAVIELFGRPVHAFSAVHERLATIMAGAAARALSNALRIEQADQHLRRRLQQLTALQRISRQLTATLSLDSILNFALREALRATRSTQGYIALRAGDHSGIQVNNAETGELIGYIALGEASDQFQVFAASGYEQEEQGILFAAQIQGTKTTAAEAITSGEAVVADTLEYEDRIAEAGPAVASAIALPIFYEDQLLGVVNLHSTQPHAFDHDAVEFVRALTDQVSLAAGNAQRYQEQVRQRELLQRRASMMNEVLSIGQVLRADRSLEEVLEQIAFSIIEVAGFRTVVFNVVAHDDPEILRVIAGAGLPLSEMERMRDAVWPRGFIHRMLDKRFRIGRSYFVPAEIMQEISAGIDTDELQDISSMSVLDERAPDEWQIDDVLVLPLYSTRAQLLGVMSVDDPFTRQRPDRRAVEPLEVFADQAAIAIENAMLLREARMQTDQMTALFQVSMASAATLDLDDLLGRVYKEIEAYLGQPTFLYVASYDDVRTTTRFELFMREGEVLASHQKLVLPKSGLTQQVIDSGEMIYIRNMIHESEHLPAQPVSLGEPIQSWLGIPLRRKDNVIGVLSVQSFASYAFSPAHVQFLETLANQLAIALENARLFQDRVRRIAELDAVNEIGRIASSTLDITQMFDQVFSLIHQFIRMDAGYMMGYDPVSHVVTPVITVDGNVYDIDSTSRYLQTGGLSTIIIENRQPLLFGNLVEERTSLNLPQPSAFGDKTKRSASWLGVPMLNGEGDVVGIISIQSYTPNLYGERDKAFLTAVATQVALGIENARLFGATRSAANALSKKVGELSTLLESARVLNSSLEPGNVLDTLMLVVGRQFGVDTVALWTISDQEGADKILVPEAMLGISTDDAQLLRPPVGQGMTGIVAASGEPLVIADVEESEMSLYPSFQRTNHLSSFMGVPVVHHDQVVGVLSVMSRKRRAFTEDEVKLLSGMADQASTALQNASLFTDGQRQITQLRTINQMSNAINATLEVNQLLVAVHKGITSVLSMDSSFIALYDETNNTITFPVLTDDGVLKTSDETMPLEGTAFPLSHAVIVQRKTILLQNRAAIEELIQHKLEPTTHQTMSWLGVPIMKGSQVLGVLAVMNHQPNAYTDHDLRFLETVASQTATALSNARLFQERERRLSEVSVLKDIGSTITSTLELNDVLNLLHQELGRVIDVSTSSIGLYDADSNTMSLQLAFDRGRPVKISPYRVPHNSVSHIALTQQRSIRLNTAADLHRYVLPETDALPPEDGEEESFLVMPIISGDEPLGVINIQSYQQYAFNEDDERFVSAVANQAAIAISNARLFQERGRRIEELKTFNEIGQELSSVGQLDELLSLLYRQTSRLMDTTNFYVVLYDERRNELAFPIFYEHKQRILREPMLVKESLTYSVIRSRQPQRLDNDAIQALVGELGVDRDGEWPLSWLGVPMIVNDTLIGVMVLRDFLHSGVYTADDERLLSTIASWGAIAVDNARLLNTTRQSFRELEMLFSVSSAINGTLDTSEIQRIVATNALDLVRADTCSVMLFNTKREELTAFVLDYQYLPEGLILVQQPVDSVVQGLLDGDWDTVFAPNHRDDIAYHIPGVDISVQNLVGTLLGPPVQPIGVLLLGSHTSRVWEDRELSLMHILANLAGQGLESARLFTSEKRRRKASDVLLQTAQALTTLRSMDEIIDLVLDQLSRVIPHDTSSLMLLEGNTMKLVRSRGFPEHTLEQLNTMRFSLEDDAILMQIVTTKQPVVHADAQLDPSFVPAEGTEHVHGWIGAPLLLNDEVIGVLNVDSHIVGAYTEEHAYVVFGLASQAAQAIANARLFAQVQSFAAELEQRVAERTMDLADLNIKLSDLNNQLSSEKERLQTIHSITLGLSESLDLEETLTKALQMVSQALNVRRGSIMLQDVRTNEAVWRAVLGTDGMVYPTRIPISFDRGPGLVGWVMEHKQPVRISDVATDKRWLQEIGRADEVRSVIAVPLLARDETHGVLMLTSPDYDYFDESQLQLLWTIANEVAIVIHNAELYAYITDIALKKADLLEQQREETSKNQAILQSLGEGVIVLDERQHVILFNPAAETMLGLSSAQILQQPLESITTWRIGSRRRLDIIYEGLYAGLSTLDQNNQMHNRRMELPDPHRTLELSFTPVIGPDTVTYGSVVVLRDVTREIEADRAKRDFISSVSHELRTPLTSIKGYVDLLLLGAGGQVSDSQMVFLTVVKNNANRLMDLINDILEIGRIDADKIELNLEPVELPDVLTDVVQTLRAEMGKKRQSINLEVSDDIPSIMADSRRITQVVLNMVSNAVKYTYNDGSIIVRAYINPAGMAQVDVEDNGVGISDEDQKHLFRRFYRADNPLRDEAGGTGLGLSIAKSFVELHGGEMWVRSEIGRGSTFSFIVPVSPVNNDPA